MEKQTQFSAPSRVLAQGLTNPRENAEATQFPKENKEGLVCGLLSERVDSRHQLQKSKLNKTSHQNTRLLLTKKTAKPGLHSEM